MLIPTGNADVPYTDRLCKEGPFGFHPEGYFDEHSVYDIKVAMTEVANTQSRQELIKFWRLRGNCPICQAAIMIEATIFADMVATLYDLLSRKDGVFSIDCHNDLLGWAESAHESGVEDFPVIEGSDLSIEVCTLANQMRVSPSTRLQRDIVESVEHWQRAERVLEEWSNLLGNDLTSKMLQEATASSSLFVSFFDKIADKLGLDAQHLGVIYDDTPVRLYEQYNSDQAVVAMAARLLIRSRFPERYRELCEGTHDNHPVHG